MDIRSLHNGNRQRANSTFERVHQRLTQMENSNFSQLTCDGGMKPVGLPSDEWTPTELLEVSQRAQEMATDPARGDKITEGGIEEAAVAFTAENLKVFGRLEREATGAAEFVDQQCNTWDVKSPLSPPPGQNWSYSPEHQVHVVQKDISKGDSVLLNLTRVNENDRTATLSLLSQELSCDERGRLLILA